MARRIQQAFLSECHKADIQLIAANLRTSKKSERMNLLTVCEKILSDKKLSADKTKRVACVKILVALLPISLPVLERWLKARKGKQAYEIHFTIFCFLDRMDDLHIPTETAHRILIDVSDYLHSVDSETASAAWMAGDLLGDHWKTEETFRVLLSAVQKGRYVAGRLACVHGLGHRLQGINPTSMLAKNALRVLEEVSRFDRSSRVRSDASLLIRAFRKKSHNRRICGFF